MARGSTLKTTFTFAKRRYGWVVLVLTAVILVASAFTTKTSTSANSDQTTADRYYIRVHSCDDGGKAYVNEAQVIDVGFNEDSDWLEITEDLAEGSNEVKFEVINKTGAITYVFQVKRNDRIVFQQACGKVNVIGCENNRAFRVGAAREFRFTIDRE